MLLTSYGSKKKEPTYASEWKATASHSSAPHLVHTGLQLSPIKCKCLFKVLCPVRKPVTILHCVLLKDRNLVLRVGLGPKIIFRTCLSAGKIPPHYHMLVIYPAFYLFPYILFRNLQGRLWFNKVVNGFVSCKLVCNFISSYSKVSRYPKQPHRMLGWNVFQCLSALLYQWGCCFNGLTGLKAAWLSEQIQGKVNKYVGTPK
jgi:hypothetical protein